MNRQNLCIYEDTGYKGFGPLTETRAVWDLRCGAFTLAEKHVARFHPFRINYHLRRKLQPLYEEYGCSAETLNPKIEGDSWLFVNGRVILEGDAAEKLTSTGDDVLFTCNSTPIAFRLSGDNLKRIDLRSGDPIDYTGLEGLRKIDVAAQVMNYPWELVNAAGEQIISDLDLALTENPGSYPEENRFVRVSILDKVKVTGEVDIRPGVVIDAEAHPVRLEEGVRLGPGVIIDADKGPVWIAAGATIEAGAALMGPVYIGPDSIVRRHGRIYNGVCLGPHCRVGGEIHKTIIQSYSNKQHSGYLGTSYVGSWVNLGASTDNSDLKNTYKPVEVTIGGEKINTGNLHVGVFIGDFSCTAIQTRLNSGTVIGVSCNIIGADFPVKDIPAFTWVGSSGYHEYSLNKALETNRSIMSRRNKTLTPAMTTLLEDIFKSSRDRRRKLLGRSR